MWPEWYGYSDTDYTVFCILQNVMYLHVFEFIVSSVGITTIKTREQSCRIMCSSAAVQYTKYQQEFITPWTLATNIL